MLNPREELADIEALLRGYSPIETDVARDMVERYQRFILQVYPELQAERDAAWLARRQKSGQQP